MSSTLEPHLRSLGLDLAAFEAVVFGDGQFYRAYQKLATTVSPGRSRHLSFDLQNYLNAVSQNRPRSVSSVGAAAMIVVYLHTTIGAPLHLDDKLFDRWCVEPGAGAVECAADGYRSPASVPTCPICGRTNGEAGIFAALRAAAVEMSPTQ